MQHRSTRRTFLATLGAAGTVAFAGCSALPGGSKSPSKTTTPPSTAPATPQGTSTKSPGTTPNGGTGGNSSGGTNNGNETKKAPFTRGKVVDDFEGDVGSRWGQPDYGTYKVTTKDAYQGSQSIVLQPRKPSKRKQSVNRAYARIGQVFTGSKKALDLSNKDLTMAVKVEKPKGPIDITANVHAPTESLSLTSTREIPKAMDDWVRYDLGYTSKSGQPNLSKVLQLELVIAVPPKGPNDFTVKIDDLRTIPKPTKGKVMFQFDDGHISAYKKGYPILKQKGWPAACAVIPSAIGSKNRLSLSMMNKMSKQGWDMMSHPPAPPNTALPGLPKQVQRRKIEQAHQQLVALGFKKGARHLVAPYNRLGGTTIDILRDVHETTFLFGGCPNNAQQPSNPYFLSRVQGSSARGAKRIIDMAAKYNQLAVVSWHVLGGQGTPVNVLKNVANYVEKKNVDVITPSQLIDGTK
jgi:peptidoglycan/xylan/chitin deacetylase (PgdA/CDA1 family)